MTVENAVAFPVVLVTRLQRNFRLRVAEWITAAMLISWGIELASNPSMFTAPFFAGFARLAPQAAWAAVAMLIGYGRLSALIVNGAWRYSSHTRAGLLVLSVFIWLGIVFGLWDVHRATLGVVVYPWLAVADAYAAYRAGRDARAADEEARLAITIR